MLRKSFALLLLMALFLTACGNKPPMPTIKAGDQKVPVEMGTYSWRFLTSHVTADSAGPADMVDVEQDAVTVPPGTKLSISFRSKPKKMELN
ncbi:MAG: hypothetical protein K0R67_2315, partial [Paenibacillus sp.]|nr:hypothetical protein [Paenibacillus sp.]